MADNIEQKSSFGRNIFTEKRGKDTNSNSPETLEIVEIKNSTKISLDEEHSAFTPSLETSKKPTLNVAPKPTAPVKSLNNNVVALHISETHSVLIAAFYDGLCYTVNKVEIEPVEYPVINEDNMMRANISEMLFKNQVESVKKLIAKSGLNAKDVYFVTAVSSKGTMIKQLQITGEEFSKIETEMPKLVVTSFENSSGHYEYIYLGNETVSGVLMHNVLIACVDNKAFFGLQGLLATAGVNCSIMDIDIMAVVNLFLESVGSENNLINCVIDIGYDTSYIIIYSPDAKESLYVRTLDFTFNAFRKMLMQNRQCSAIEAEKMIAERNFSEYFTKAFEQETTENLNDLYSIKNYLKRDLLTELSRTFDFYKKKGSNRNPSDIYVTGKALDMKNFAQFLVKNIDIRCEELDVGGFLMGSDELKEKIQKNRSVVYKAVGLVLRYE